MTRSGRGSVYPCLESEVRGWDAVADVVVVGAGCSGTAAALSAVEAGSDVVVLEAAGGGGGTSSMSGGELYLGGGTGLQKACGYRDSPEAMSIFLAAALGPHCDEEKIAAYSEGSPAHFDWLVDAGVPFKATMYTEPTWVPPTDDGLVWLGENSYPFDELAPPAPRGHRPRCTGYGGRLIMERLLSRLSATAANVRIDTTAARLIVDRGGAVVGVIGRQYASDVAIRARRGVVLAGGGFAFNTRMVAEHAPLLLQHTPAGTDHDDGHAILMGQSVGGAVQRMSAAQVALRVSVALLVRSILVNKRGQRFINEDTYPGLISQATFFNQEAAAYMILDENAYEDVPELERLGQRPDWVAGSVEDLAGEIGIPAPSLQATVDLYNRFAQRGEDPIFHKRRPWVRPLQAPFAAMDVRRRSTDPRAPVQGDRGTGFYVFTLGGLHTTVDGEVLSLEGEPIPGLYAVGRSGAGLPTWGYISGISLGEGTYFGRRAGTAARLRTG